MSKVPRSSPSIPATCEFCGVEFVALRGTTGRFCTLSCFNRGRNRPLSVQLGERYGAWVVLGHAVREAHSRRTFFNCRCECGHEQSVRSDQLRNGRSSRCKQCDNDARVRHGATRIKNYTPEYRAWNCMRQRCTNPHNASWDRYGGRGIRVCERWASFQNFLADMGERPSAAHSLDRVDGDGDYEPGNVRWGTVEEQANNRRSTPHVEFEGESMTIAQWARRKGIPVMALRQRLRHGWSLERALLTPVNSPERE